MGDIFEEVDNLFSKYPDLKKYLNNKEDMKEGKSNKKEEKARELQAKKKEDILLRNADGQTIEEIAAETGAGLQEVADVVALNREEAETLKAVKDEAFLKANGADNRSRLLYLVAIRQKLINELSERSLEDLSTDKLLSLMIKINENIEREAKKPLLWAKPMQEKLTEERKSGYDYLGYQKYKKDS